MERLTGTITFKFNADIIEGQRISYSSTILLSFQNFFDFINHWLDGFTPGRLKVSQDSSNLVFNLHCRDYTSMYSHLMRNTEKVDNILSQANKPVSLNMPKPDDDENADIEDKAKEQKNIERTEKYMQRFGDFLSFKNENTNSVSYGPLSRIPTNCQKAKDFINIFCQNYSSFISEHYESMGWSKTVATCSTVKMDTSTNTYLIYFSYPLDESDVLSKFPTINFIRLVPGDD